MAAAVFAVSSARGAAPRGSSAPPRGPAPAAKQYRPQETVVRAPVRIADAAVARLVHPGSRVDVLAAGKVVAAGAPVVSVPADPDAGLTSVAGIARGDAGQVGALIVVSVPRRTAAALSGAAASSPLAVALC
jgi:hypothetical protein